MATEKVTVYGLPIVAARKVNYSQIDPALCRELFIRHALVEATGRRATPSSAKT
jgi:ATP-dependent helicase HrpA